MRPPQKYFSHSALACEKCGRHPPLRLSRSAIELFSMVAKAPEAGDVDEHALTVRCRECGAVKAASWSEFADAG